MLAGVKKYAPAVGKIASGVSRVASLIPHPYAQAIGKVAGVVGKAANLAQKLRAEGATEEEALEAFAELAAKDPRALPIVAGLTARTVLKGQGAQLSPAARKQLVHQMKGATTNLVAKRGLRAVRAMPKIAKTVKRTAAAKGLSPVAATGGAAHRCQGGAQPRTRPQALAAEPGGATDGARGGRGRRGRGTPQLHDRGPGPNHHHRGLTASTIRGDAAMDVPTVRSISVQSLGTARRDLRVAGGPSRSWVRRDRAPKESADDLRAFLRQKIVTLAARARRLGRLDPEARRDTGPRTAPTPRPRPTSGRPTPDSRRSTGRSPRRLAFLRRHWSQATPQQALLYMALVEREIDRARRAFGMFFEVFSQRGSAFAPALAAHDAIAADCYAAVHAAAPLVFRGPLLKPLTYMEHGYSPATTRRGIALSRLLGEPNPFPLIRIPWDRDNPWQAVFLHEVAHNLQADLGLWDENQGAVARRLQTHPGGPVGGRHLPALAQGDLRRLGRPAAGRTGRRLGDDGLPRPPGPQDHDLQARRGTPHGLSCAG